MISDGFNILLPYQPSENTYQKLITKNRFRSIFGPVFEKMFTTPSEEIVNARKALDHMLFVGIRIPMDQDLPNTDFGNKMRKLREFLGTEKFKEDFPNLVALFYNTYHTERVVIIPVGIPIDSEFFRAKSFFAEINIISLRALLYRFGFQRYVHRDREEPLKLHELEVEIEMLKGDEMWNNL